MSTRAFVKPLSLLSILALLTGASWAVAQETAKPPENAPPAVVLRDVFNFNSNWRFEKGSHEQSVQPEFDDSAWEQVRLPHDWAIAGPFDPQGSGKTGKLPWEGEGWYRKTFRLDRANAGKHVILLFDAVMAFPTVWINGRKAGAWDYGYNSFQIDATDYVKFGENNTIVVHVDTRKQRSRWYPGAGIYRKVTMFLIDPVHVPIWGVWVATPKVTDKSADVSVRTTVQNDSRNAQELSLKTTILDPQGRNVAQKSEEKVLESGKSFEFDQTLMVENPKQWDIEAPNLYTVQTRVNGGLKMFDAVETTFGIRTLKWTVDDGFHLNGRRVQLKGVNLHHDHGPLGAKFLPRAMERQLEIMKDMGANAIRTSHNVPAPELLDLCDRMGLLVVDESFDKWDATAGYFGEGIEDFVKFQQRQVRNFVMRDRNHPSVIIWSIGNELLGMGQSRLLVPIYEEYDPTRLTTLASYGGHSEWLGVLGWNYGRKYAVGKQRWPDKPALYTESASALSTRGFYELPHPVVKTGYNSKTKQIDSYDLNSASGPRDIPDVDFLRMEQDRYCGGEFVWTGFDYLGEPTPFTMETRSSYFGIVDLCGIPKDRYYLYRSHWNREKTTVHILPHWNWPERIGTNVPVYIYTNGDEAELFLNGKSLGRKKKRVVGPEEANPDLALNKPTKASSETKDNSRAKASGKANDGDSATSWCAADGTAPQWWQVDLGRVQPIRTCMIHWDSDVEGYQYRLLVSKDGEDWQAVAEKNDFSGSGLTSIHRFEAQGRYVRIDFMKLRGKWAGFCEVQLYTKPQELQSELPYYYWVVDLYRLRWEDVIYEPGELKAIAYKNGKEIGQAVVRTAGKPAQIRLTPDRTQINADGDDLSYVLVEMADKDGNLCPQADHLIRFNVDGPAAIAGVGNGNPLSLEPFVADYRKLFYGKAMLILRSVDGKTGPIKITATTNDIKSEVAQVLAR